MLRILCTQAIGILDRRLGCAVPGRYRHLAAGLPVAAALPTKQAWQLGVKPREQHQRVGHSFCTFFTLCAITITITITNLFVAL